MSIIKRMRKQAATWWQRTEERDIHGKVIFEEPVQIKCRWVDVAEEFVDSQGAASVSKSKVYVDRVMAQGDRLKRGEIDYDTATDPLELTDAHEIRRFDQTPNLRNTETLFTAYL